MRFSTLALALSLLSPAASAATCPIEGRPVRVGVPVGEPFVIPDGDSYTGFDIEIWERIAERIGCDETTYVPIGLSDRIPALESGTVDMVVGGMTMTSEREEHIDFSHAYFKTGQAILYREEKPQGFRYLAGYAAAFWDSTLRTFLIGLVAFVAFWAVVIWALEWIFGRHNDKDGDPTNDILFSRLRWLGLAQAVWFVNVTMTTVGYGDYTPKTLPGRLATLFMMWSGIAYGGLFLSAIVTFGTTMANAEQPMSIDVLRGEEVVVVAGTTGEQAVMGYGVMAKPVASLQEAIAAVMSSEAKAAVFDQPDLLYAVAQGKADSLKVSDTFTKEFYAFGFPTHGALQERVNVKLLEMLEREENDALKEKYFGKD